MSTPLERIIKMINELDSGGNDENTRGSGSNGVVTCGSSEGHGRREMEEGSRGGTREGRGRQATETARQMRRG